MTIVLRELAGVSSQTVDNSPPEFQPRALLAYGHGQNTHGKSTGGAFAAWGGYTETQGAFGGADWGITSPGSLETGAGGNGPPGSSFYGETGGTFTNVFHDPVYDCGEFDVQTGSVNGNYIGLFILGGRTLETAVGEGTFSGTGTHAITGLGFQPGLILMGGTGHNTHGGHGAGSGGADFQTGLGAADAHGNQFAIAAGAIWNASTTGRKGQTVDDACFVQVYPGFMKADLVSMDADGFTLNVSTYYGAQYFWWMAFSDAGGDFAVGTFTEGDASITPGFTPEAIMFASGGHDALATDQFGIALAYGGASSEGNMFAGYAQAAAANAVSARSWSTKALSWLPHPTSTGFVTECEAEVSSWGSTCNLNWTLLGARSLIGGYVAFKTSEGRGYAGCGNIFRPQIYRRKGGGR